MNAPKVLMVMGPTATGKTDLALDLAERFDGEVISVDSALVYEGMDVGTAKPSAEELARVPHHLIDIIDPSRAYSAARFREDALALIDDIAQRGKLPILAGGTMLYFRALLDGIAAMPEADEQIRQTLDVELQERGAQALHEELCQIDPVAGQRIHVNDPQRLLRALEVFRISGKTLTAFHEEQQAQRFELPHLKLGLIPSDRERHRALVAERFEKMLDMGFLDEVEQLMKIPDLHLDLPSIRCVGYRQAWLYLTGEWSYEEMKERAIIATRQLAKRQMTWLRKEPALQVYDCFETDKTELLRQSEVFLKTN